MARRKGSPRGWVARGAPPRAKTETARTLDPVWLGRIALIIAAGACTYWNGLAVPFLWDDQTSIVNNESIRSLWPPWALLLPPAETPVAGRPLVNLSLALNYAIDGLEVTGYHLWNLGVHLLCALVLFSLVRRTLGAGRLRDRFGADASSLALVATLAWMLHPLTSEVVNYTTQRSQSMMAAFFLLTLWCAVRALDAPHQRRWQVLAVLACAFGSATKEDIAAVPIVVALYDRAFVFSSFREALQTRRHLYLGLAATWVGLGVLIWLSPRSTVGFSTDVGWWTYALNQAQLIPHYLQLALWPDRLVLDYGLPRPLALQEVAGRAFLVLALLAAAALALARWPMIGFPAAVFFLTLAPTTSVIPIVSEVGAERRMYLPLAAIAVLVVVGGWGLLTHVRSRLPARIGRLTTAAAVTATIVSLAVLAARTVSRNAEFGDPVSLWRSSVERWPHGRARLSYATALVEAANPALALSELRLAVGDYPDARYALGVELAARGENTEAAAELERFIAAAPAAANRVPARLLLGRLLAAEKRLEESARQFRAVLDVAPSTVDAHASLGDLLVQQERYAEAARHYRAVLARVPREPDWHVRLGRALELGGEPDAAALAYSRALEIDPAWRIARLSLAELSLRRNRVDEAIVHAQEAVRRNERDPVAHNLLGSALARSGRLDEAFQHFQQAVTADPGNEQARANLDQAAALLGRNGSDAHVVPARNRARP